MPRKRIGSRQTFVLPDDHVEWLEARARERYTNRSEIMRGIIGRAIINHTNAENAPIPGASVAVAEGGSEP